MTKIAMRNTIIQISKLSQIFFKNPLITGLLKAIYRQRPMLRENNAPGTGDGRCLSIG
jgi:hypothetical protein